MSEQGTVNEAGAPDPFATTFGDGRGGEGSTGFIEREKAAQVTALQRQRRILALAGAHGILGHNTAVSMPGSFAKGRIAAFIEHGGKGNLSDHSEVSDELVADIEKLASQGFLRCNSFGHSKDRDLYSITPAGLVELWTGTV